MLAVEFFAFNHLYNLCIFSWNLARREGLGNSQVLGFVEPEVFFLQLSFLGLKDKETSVVTQLKDGNDRLKILILIISFQLNFPQSLAFPKRNPALSVKYQTWPLK